MRVKKDIKHNYVGVRITDYHVPAIDVILCILSTKRRKVQD